MISKDDLVEDLVQEHPDAVGFLLDRGVVCVKCGEPFWGPLGDLIAGKGLDVDEVVSDLNAALGLR
jgi:hypothetical protein